MRRDGQHASRPASPLSFSLYLPEPGLSCHSFAILFLQFEFSRGGKKVLIFLFASGKVEGEAAQRLKECCWRL